jgi:protein phosphatase
MQGMGCTMVACFIDKKTAYLCHVGDVRGYVLNGEGLSQITTDHSMALPTSAGDEGESPRKTHVVTRGIGFPFPEDPEFHQFDVEPGNKILLCSDGLWNMVDDTQLRKVMMQDLPPMDVCGQLVDLANEAGGQDNITAVIIQI